MFIYKIINIKSGIAYVGSTKHLEKRLHEHLKRLNRGKHENRYLQSAWNKYGESSFSFDMVEECSDLNWVEREQYWIDYYDSQGMGYNICMVANKPPMNDDIKRALSDKAKGRVVTQETRKKISKSLKNRVFTEEHRVKLSEANRNRKMRPEHKEKLRQINTGKIKSEATRQKLSKANKGRRHTEEVKARLSEAAKQRIYTEQDHNKVAAGKLKGRTFSFLSPDGVLYENVGNLSSFAREHNLLSQSLSSLIRGKTKTHKGWTYVSESNQGEPNA